MTTRFSHLLIDEMHTSLYYVHSLSHSLFVLIHIRGMWSLRWTSGPGINCQEMSERDRKRMREERDERIKKKRMEAQIDGLMECQREEKETREKRDEEREKNGREKERERSGLCAWRVGGTL